MEDILMKKIILLCLLLLCMAGITACGQEKEQAVKAEPATAVFQTSMGDFEIKLATDYAPKTSENFIKLAKQGYYDGLTFHRVIDNFMIHYLFLHPQNALWHLPLLRLF